MRLTALAAALPPLLALGLAGPGNAHAEPVAIAQVKIVVDAQGPLLGDSSNAVYGVIVHNDGRATATGLVVRAVTRTCYSTETLISDCDERSRAYFQLSDLRPGEAARFPYTISLTDDDAAQPRTTIRVVHVDQFNTGTFGGCQRGGDADDSCVVLEHTIPR